jgi:hypothetical protein
MKDFNKDKKKKEHWSSIHSSSNKSRLLFSNVILFEVVVGFELGFFP